MINRLFDYGKLPRDTPQEVISLLKSTGVGKWDESLFSHGVNDLCVEFEKSLPLIAAKLKMDEEVSTLKKINLITDHTNRVHEAIARQNEKLPSKEQHSTMLEEERN